MYYYFLFYWMRKPRHILENILSLKASDIPGLNPGHMAPEHTHVYKSTPTGMSYMTMSKVQNYPK